MRILLQDAHSRLYFEGPGAWTADLTAAYDFGSSQAAIVFAREHRLTAVQVLAAFIDHRCVDVVPLGLDPRRDLCRAA